MIYLLQDCYKNDKGEYIDILKIGYSEKPFMESRNNQYKTHNYGYKFLGEREGDTITEELFHKKYSSFSLSPLTEWMLFSDEIVDGFFNLSEDDLLKEFNEVPEKIEKEILIKNLQEDLVSTISNYLYSTNKDSLIEEFKEYTKNEEEIKEGLRLFKESLINELTEINSISVIEENSFIKSLPDVIDISLDLPQIIGRQRLKENVFRNEVLILYKAESKKAAIINEKKLVNDEKVNEKLRKTKSLLDAYSTMTPDQKKDFVSFANERAVFYKNDYIGISSRTGEAMFNYLVKVADQRAYDVSRKEYQDDISIKRGIEGLKNIKVDYYDTESDNIVNDLKDTYENFMKEFDKDNDFVRRMKLLYDTQLQYPELFIQYSTILSINIPITYQNYINLLGFERIKALNYKEKKIQEYINSLKNLEINSVSDLFSVGDKYTKKQIKEMLGEFYTTHNIIKTPKASDLEQYYILKSIKLKVGDKWENGFEIIKLR